MPATLFIRPYADSDHAAVRALFIEVNRALAPADMRETFDGYIETALAAEIDRLDAFYNPARQRILGRACRLPPGRHGRPGARLA
jgi:hypothetical protein